MALDSTGVQHPDLLGLAVDAAVRTELKGQCLPRDDYRDYQEASNEQCYVVLDPRTLENRRKCRSSVSSLLPRLGTARVGVVRPYCQALGCKQE
jgi:hypothetical protein